MKITGLPTIDGVTPTHEAKMPYVSCQYYASIAHKYEIPCAACQYCESIVYRSNACPKVSECSTCKTKSHRPYYICILLQSTSSGQAQGQNGFHSEDSYLGLHDKSDYGINNAPRDLHVSPSDCH